MELRNQEKLVESCFKETEDLAQSSDKIQQACEGQLKIPENAIAAVNTMKIILMEDPSTLLRNAHKFKKINAEDVKKLSAEDEAEALKWLLILKLTKELHYRLETEGYSNAKMLFMESVEEAQLRNSRKIQRKETGKKKSMEGMKKLFSNSKKGVTRKDLNFNLKYGKGIDLDCSPYSISVLTEELLKLLKESPPLLCGSDRALFNQYIKIQAKTEEGVHKIHALVMLISALPDMNQVILKSLFGLLLKIWQNEAQTNMDAEMLAYAVGPVLLHQPKGTRAENEVIKSNFNFLENVQGIVLSLIKNSGHVFQTPPVALDHIHFNAVQTIVHTVFETLRKRLDTEPIGPEVIRAMHDLIHVVQSVRSVSSKGVKSPFIKCPFPDLPVGFWVSLVSMLHETESELAEDEGRSAPEVLDVVRMQLQDYFMLEPTEAQMENVILAFKKKFQLESEEQEELTECFSPRQQAEDDNKGDVKSEVLHEKDKRRTRASVFNYSNLKKGAYVAIEVHQHMPRTGSVAEQANKCAQPDCSRECLSRFPTKFCREHFEDNRLTEDSMQQWRVKALYPGVMCDVLKERPAVLYDVDLGLKLSSTASYFIHNDPTYSKHLTYDIELSESNMSSATLSTLAEESADLATSEPPISSNHPSLLPSSSSANMPALSSAMPTELVRDEWRLIRKREKPPEVSGIDDENSSMNVEDTKSFVLDVVRAIVVDMYDSTAAGGQDGNKLILKPPAGLAMLAHAQVVWEIITTEETYYKVLKSVTELYWVKVKNAGSDVLPELEKEKLFRNIGRMSEFHKKFLSDIHRQFCTWTNDVSTQRIAGVFISFAKSLDVYPRYVIKHDDAIELLKHIESNPNKYSKFHKLQKAAEASPLYMGKLDSCLIAPIQRIPRYRLLIEELLRQYKKTIPDHPDIESLQKALELILDYATQVNEQLRRSEQEREMVVIRDTLSNHESHGQLVTGSRFLVHKGNLTRICRKSDTVYYFCLFNDLMVYCKKNTNESYSIKKWIPIDDKFIISEVPKDNKEKGGRPARWAVQSKVKSFQIYTNDAIECARWTKHFGSLLLQQKSRKDQVEGELAPVWVSDHDTSVCTLCERKFTLVRRRHHCRKCGAVVCQQCSNNKEVLATSSGQAVRICTRCHAMAQVKLKERRMSMQTMQPIAQNLGDATDSLAVLEEEAEKGATVPSA